MPDTAGPGQSQMDRIEQLLTEIRDRLPGPPNPPRPPSLFGYEQGQERPPGQTEVEMARRFLRGELWDSSTMVMPVVAWTLAREIVDRSESR